MIAVDFRPPLKWLTTASHGVEISQWAKMYSSGKVLTVDAPPGPTFAPSLDDALKEARRSDASTLRRGDMVEIIGASGTGASSGHFRSSTGSVTTVDPARHHRDEFANHQARPLSPCSSSSPGSSPPPCHSTFPRPTPTR